MRGAFRKISRVGSLTGGTKWYLSEDCLLAAKRVMYAVEYRRFYLRDLESIVVWPNRLWLLRAIIPAVVFVAWGNSMWYLVNFAAGASIASIGLLWAGLELALGPTAKAQIKTTGLTVDLPIVGRVRRAERVLAKIDAALRAARADLVQPPTAPVPAQSAASSVQTSPETASAPAPIGDLI